MDKSRRVKGYRLYNLPARLPRRHKLSGNRDHARLRRGRALCQGGKPVELSRAAVCRTRLCRAVDQRSVDRKSVVEVKRVSVRVDHGGGRIIEQENRPIHKKIKQIKK